MVAPLLKDRHHTADLVADFEALDFLMIIKKLQDADEGAGWSNEYCRKVQAEYLRFLGLTRHYRDRAIAPLPNNRYLLALSYS